MSAASRRPLANAFGATLRATRLKQGLSQDKLAARCGFDRTYPSLLERGLRSPSLAMVFRLADALGTPGEELVADTWARMRGGVQS